MLYSIFHKIRARCCRPLLCSVCSISSRGFVGFLCPYYSGLCQWQPYRMSLFWLWDTHTIAFGPLAQAWKLWNNGKQHGNQTHELTRADTNQNKTTINKTAIILEDILGFPYSFGDHIRWKQQMKTCHQPKQDFKTMIFTDSSGIAG